MSGSANMKGRGNPKVKGIQGFRSRAQLARFSQSLGLDDEDQHWRCCCKYPGHTRTFTWWAAFAALEDDGLLEKTVSKHFLCTGSALTRCGGSR